MLKSLIRMHWIFGLSSIPSARSKNSLFFLYFSLSLQYIWQRLKFFFSSLMPGIFSVGSEKTWNSTIAGLVISLLASIEFWQISLASELNFVPRNVSIPEFPMPAISPPSLFGKFHSFIYLLPHNIVKLFIKIF